MNERFRTFLDWHTLVVGGRIEHAETVDEHTLRYWGANHVPQAVDLHTGTIRTDITPASAPPAQPAGRQVRANPTEGLPAVVEIPSPDGTAMLTEIGHDLGIRDVATDTVRRLTDTGTSQRPWRVNAQAVGSVVLTPPVWSPDGSRVASLQATLEGMPDYPLIDYSTYPPRVTSTPYPVESVAGHPSGRLAIIDTAAGTTTWSTKTDACQYIPVRWTDDETAFLAVAFAADGELSLLRIEADTGVTRHLVTDRVAALFAYLPVALGAALTPLPGGLGWVTDYDGDLRLYRVDPDSGALEALSPPGVQVARVLGPVTEHALLLLARADPARPYDVHVCRTDEHGDFRVLTNAPGTHSAVPLPAGEVFLDTHSSLTRPPRTDLRRADGTLITVVERADTTAAEALERPHPEEFTVLAADGVTELHGLLFPPTLRDPAQKYPVIDSLYGGPNMIAHQNAYVETPQPSGSVWTCLATIAQAFGQLGFAGIVLDARGTPGRGRAFQAAAADGFGTIAVHDHVAAIHQLAEQYPWLDPTRCGAIGLSFGGYHAARCGLLAPETFRAVVAAGGSYDPAVIAPGWFHALLGAAYQDDPDAYAEAGLTAHASHFNSNILLIHGSHDTNTPLAHTMRFSDALVRAGKRHEMMILQNQGHQLNGPHQYYALDAAAEFFNRHLHARSQ